MSKPRIRFFTGRPYRVENGRAKTTKFQIFCNCRWLVIYEFISGPKKGTYEFKDGKDGTISFRTINELIEKVNK